MAPSGRPLLEHRVRTRTEWRAERVVSPARSAAARACDAPAKPPLGRKRKCIQACCMPITPHNLRTGQQRVSLQSNNGAGDASFTACQIPNLYNIEGTISFFWPPSPLLWFYWSGKIYQISEQQVHAWCSSLVWTILPAVAI